MGGNVTLGIAFGEPGIDASDFPKVAKAVKTVMEAFQADFPETVFVD